MQTTNIDYSKQKLWMAAIKPPMYSVAIMPIVMGTAGAYTQNHTINYGIFITFLLSAILILAWENLSNDVFDSETGIDENKRESLVNLTGNKNLIFWLGNLCLLLGILGIVNISWMQQDVMVIGIILLACFLGYTYQGPPFRLGYQGLGEIICFICFGPLGVTAAFYSQTHTISMSIIPCGIILGITTSIILFCSHFHQVKDDINAGKKSPIVRMGTEAGAQILKWVCVSIYIISGGFIWAGILPIWGLLIFVSLPFAYKLVNFVAMYHNQPEKVRTCKFLAVNLHFVSGVLLTLALVL